MSTPKQAQSNGGGGGGGGASNPFADAPRRASVVDPFGAQPGSAAAATGGFGATPFDTPFDDTPNDWVKF